MRIDSGIRHFEAESAGSKQPFPVRRNSHRLCALQLPNKSQIRR